MKANNAANIVGRLCIWIQFRFQCFHAQKMEFDFGIGLTLKHAKFQIIANCPNFISPYKKAVCILLLPFLPTAESKMAVFHKKICGLCCFSRNKRQDLNENGKK